MISPRITERQPLPYLARIWVLLLLAPSAWLDFIPWTGLFMMDEYLIWATFLGVAGWLLVRSVLRSGSHSSDPAQNLVLGLLAITWTAALVKVWWPIPAIGPNTFWSYLEPGNAIRIWAGIAIALLAIPVMNAMWRSHPDSMARTLSSAMLLAALGAGIILLWERMAFPGLLNFSSDYRTTGFFSDMRVGGAALDGYLSLVVPFVLVAALSARNLRTILIYGALFALMIYAVMSTFSRALQLAVILSSLLVLVTMTRSHTLTEDTTARPVKEGGSVVAWVTALCALLFYTVFAHGGYRGLLSVLCCVVALLHTIREGGWQISGKGLAAAIITGAAVSALYLAPYKGPYFAFALAFLVWLAAAITSQFTHRMHLQPLLLPLTLPMAIAAAGVSFHWGDTIAGSQTALGLLLMYITGFLVALPRVRPKIQPRNLFVALLAGIMLAVISVPVLSNYRMTERIGTTGTDWEGRIRHWQGAWNLMHQDWTGVLFGEGLGTFPAAYYIAHYTGDQQAEKPGGIRREYESGEHFIRSFKAGGPNEWGEPLQLIQRISVDPDETLTVSGLVRTTQQGVLSLIVCEKWLLYHENCVNADIKTIPDNTWQPFTVTLKTPPANRDNSGILPRFSSLSVFGSPVTDIDRLSIVNQSGREMLRNGSFENGMLGWFVASDHTHMPWHTKNMAVGLFFDGGLVLLGTFCLFGLLIVVRLTPCVLAGDRDCISHAAALLGFGIVASFDTVIDAPRVAFLFMVVATSALSASRLSGKKQPVPANSP